jgi:hypothetical protein
MRSPSISARPRAAAPAGEVSKGSGKQPAKALAAGQELFVRHARRDGRSVAVMRAIDYGDSCVVEAEVYPVGVATDEAARPGPYTFADAHEATAFVTEAVEALMYLGCDVQAN